MMREVGPPRGVLKPQQAAGVFHHARIAPAPDLESIVQHYWSVRWDLRGLAPQVRETLPHPNLHLVFDPGRTRVHGVHDGRFTTVLEGVGGVFGVKLRPGGFRGFLDRAVATLRGRSLPLDEVFGAEAAAWETRLLAEADDAGRVEVAEGFLRARKPADDADALLAGRIVDAIEADRDTLRVEDLVERWGLGQRSLQRLFREYVGIGPKWVINRYRLHEVLALADAGGPVDWTAVAQDLGYFDHAHFIRDFRALVGCTPTAYVQRSPDRKGVRV